MDQKKPFRWWRGSLVYILILIVIVALVFSFLPGARKSQQVDLFTFIGQVKEGKVDTVQQDENIIVGLKDHEEKIESGFIGNTTELVNILEKSGVTVGENGVTIEVKARKFDWAGLLISFVPLILFGGLLFLLFRSIRKKA